MLTLLGHTCFKGRCLRQDSLECISFRRQRSIWIDYKGLGRRGEGSLRVFDQQQPDIFIIQPALPRQG